MFGDAYYMMPIDPSPSVGNITMEDLLNRLEHQIRTLLYQHDHLKQSMNP